MAVALLSYSFVSVPQGRQICSWALSPAQYSWQRGGGGFLHDPISISLAVLYVIALSFVVQMFIQPSVLYEEFLYK